MSVGEDFSSQFLKAMCRQIVSKARKTFLKFLSKCFRLPISADLARLIIPYRENRQIFYELAQCMVDLTACRKREFI